MWQETKHGLYKQFVFDDFRQAWAFMQRVASAVNRLDHHPRWQNEWNVVDIWLATHEDGMRITERDHELANTIDTLVSADNSNNMASTGVRGTTVITEVQLYADGGSRGNPGPSASGYVLLDMSGRVVLRKGEYLGVTTNNQAEYQALKLGLEHALHDYQSREVHVYMDSMLVINQMKNIFKIKNRDLWPIHNACLELVQKFHKVTFDHVPRELNKLADDEVNKAMDAALAHSDGSAPA
ncbi:MAG TPA: reverse transcriptase-like protein [Candidatus Saccharimonadales bacterium]|nr:reverse transcriptase-like protein [Candidatus Saccharimonadales bacterium]